MFHGFPHMDDLWMFRMCGYQICTHGHNLTQIHWHEHSWFSSSTKSAKFSALQIPMVPQYDSYLMYMIHTSVVREVVMTHICKNVSHYVHVLVKRKWV